MRDALAKLPELTDIDANEGEGAQQINLVVDRATAQRLGVDMAMITSVLNNAFSQRADLHHLRVAQPVQCGDGDHPAYAQYPEALDQIQVISADGARVPLSGFARWDAAWRRTGSTTRASSRPRASATCWPRT